MPTGVYPRPSLGERLWAKVVRSTRRECWPFVGAHSRRGYGQIWDNGRLRPAAQVAWELVKGRPFPVDRESCHSCDNPPCCNPAHVSPGTRRRNVRECIERGRFSQPPHPRGEAHPRAKLNRSAVRLIRHSRCPVSALARRYRVSRMAIYLVQKGKNWSRA